MVLLKGVQIGSLYNMKGITISDGSKSSIVSKIGFEEETNPTSFGENTMLWDQIPGYIEEKGFRLLHGKCIVECMSKFSLDFDLCEHYVYGQHNLVIFPSGAMREDGIL
jgi:hypothetical protein